MSSTHNSHSKTIRSVRITVLPTKNIAKNITKNTLEFKKKIEKKEKKIEKKTS